MRTDKYYHLLVPAMVPVTIITVRAPSFQICKIKQSIIIGATESIVNQIANVHFLTSLSSPPIVLITFFLYAADFHQLVQYEALQTQFMK